ncbi:hypothetical protein [Leptothoe spongobia]|uniref:Uncharacterized protein n=1 Tax=Leptothoe spongobia TAU-MAC 1115 TaxID=1967444 RepID=A0A947GMX0_9CYAN|nr:hypothetical protein [Leptothoe spongobia]MBT9317922.1 hypothetical protein [Leptothoe spongobia TAU-MAC 1115]
MSITVLPQLVEAESALSEQEAALMQQLADIQEQRKGLQTVIGMFDGSVVDNGQSAVVAAPIDEPVDDEDADADADADADEAEDEVVVEETVAAKLAKVTKAKSTARKAKLAKTRKAKTVKSAPVKKADGRSARWQRYVLDEHSQQRLQDVVVNVLNAKPKNSFKITDVMSAIFEDDMPKAQYLKARSRISNILSAGARDNEWYRGRGGTYSMSAKAVKG